MVLLDDLLDETEKIALAIFLIYVIFFLPGQTSLGLLIGFAIGLLVGSEIQYRILKKQVRGTLAGLFLRFK
jgi:hypothetical protein